MSRGRTTDAIRRGTDNPLIPGVQPAAPRELTADEAELWDEIIGALPQNWIPPEAYVVLESYTQHCCYARALAAEIDAARAEIAAAREQPVPEAQSERDRIRLDRERTKAASDRQRLLLRLMSAHANQTAHIAALAGKLRLTPSSRSSPDRSLGWRKQAGVGVRPWRDWGSGTSEQ